MNPSQLRANIYQVLDEILRTGKPVEIERKGKRLVLAPAEAPKSLANLERKPGLIVGDPEDIVHVDWSDNWSNGKDLS